MQPAVIVQEALKLDLDQRLEVAEAIWDSIATSSPAPRVPDWHKAELDRRFLDIEDHPTDEAPWAEVRERLARER